MFSNEKVVPSPKRERTVLDELTPAEMRSLLRAAQFVLADRTSFVRVHPKIVDQRVALGALKKLSEGIKKASNRRGSLRAR